MDNKDTINARTADMLRSLAQSLSASQFDVELVGAKSGEAIIKRRVFNQGLDKNGNKIGDYSTKSAYFSRGQFVRKSAFKPGGKKNPKRKNKKDPKTMYIAEGYKGLRSVNGRQVGYVDLQYTGDLFQSIQIVGQGDRPVLKIITKKEADISEGLEKRFGKTIFELGASEIALVKRDMGLAVDKLIKKFLKQGQQ